MNLSTRAQNCLKRGGRTVECPDPLEVGQALVDAGLPAFDPVIDALVEFGGYWHPLGISGTFQIYTVKKAIHRTDLEPVSSDPDEFRLAFGKHPTAQFTFWLDGHAKIYADSILIFDSPRQWIESYALHEKVESWRKCVRIVLPEPKRGFTNWANSQFQIQRPASGTVSTWWLGSEWALTRFLPWSVDRMEHWNWLFATNAKNGEIMAGRFSDEFNLDPLEISDWP